MLPSSLDLRLAAGLAVLSPTLPAAEAIFRPKVVVVSMFEIGADTGDAPGEFQFWVERKKLDRVISLPAASHPVHALVDGWPRYETKIPAVSVK